ncbi:unnamed protein product [Meganyctiphanes norvegica]|uniref:Ankyrin repeat domain-containing protein 29 n=1 Tax=Meganyctiphanes norvegica TaxID=48144 RepID=A0AAV2RD74_MEGNR
MPVSTRWDARLHSAAIHGNLEEAVRVLDSGRVDVDAPDRDGTTPLILAAANGHVEVMQELLEQGADPNATRNTGTGALFFAAQCGFLDVVMLLLDNGAQINKASKDGGTAMIVAAQCGHDHIVAEMLRRGADVNMAMRDRATAIFVAAQNGHDHVVKRLIDHGSTTTMRRQDGAGPLWIAAQMGHASVVKVLLQNGAHPDTARYDGATPLFKAAHKGHLEVVRELLPYKPKLGLLKNGESALHAAALYGQDKVVKMLIESGADPALKNDQGLTPFHIASEARHMHVCTVIKEAMAKRAAVMGSSPSKHPSRGPSPKPTTEPVNGFSQSAGSSSRASSRNSLETIVETSPVLPRSNSQKQSHNSNPPTINHYQSCELTDGMDGRPRTGLAAGSVHSVGLLNQGSSAPSPSPSISSEPTQSLMDMMPQKAIRHQSQTDLGSMKSIFKRTLASFKRSTIVRKNEKQNEL